MKARAIAGTLALLGITGCAAIPEVPPSDYGHMIVGSWVYNLYAKGERIPIDAIFVFHDNGRWGIRPLTPPSNEDFYGRRWHIERNRLVLHTPGVPEQSAKIVSFTADRLVTRDDGLEVIYTRIRLQRNAPNQAMQRTAR